jgi:hypothetical protein
MIRLLCTVSTLSFLACAAHAGASFGLQWVQIDNSSADPSSDPGGAAAWNGRDWYTYDLLLTGVAGTEFNAVNLGFAPNPGQEPYYLFTTSDAIFNYPPPGGGDVQSGFEGFFNLTRFDSYVDLGSLNPDGAAPGQIGTLGVDLNGVTGSMNGLDGRFIRGTWFEFPPNSATLDANGEARLLRITLAANPVGATLLGGNGSALFIGTNEGGQFLDITAIYFPSPGTAGVLTIAGVVAARRRR